jgi:hypothetical protein
MGTPSQPGSGLSDRIKAKAKTAAGHVLGDQDLVHEGELHEQKADALAEARRLEETADERQAAADRAERQRQIDAERAQLAVEAAADARQQRIDVDAAQAEQTIEQQRAQKERGIDAKASAEKQAAARAEAQAVLDHGAEQRSAAELEEAAQRAEMAADMLDAAAQTTREQ